jgi:hypothetical protein
LCDDFKERGVTYRPLLTSRAAALRDLGRWEEALLQVNHVIAISAGRGGPEIMGARGRVKAARPDLFDG